ncbi:MAG: hypothetical protein AVDCRST_MAG16-2539, partial [uncultured Frankineae bacterium]
CSRTSRCSDASMAPPVPPSLGSRSATRHRSTPAPQHPSTAAPPPP